MGAYKQELQKFRRNTSLVTFCRAQKRRRVDPPPGFRKVAVEHHWPDTVTLEVVETFRQEFACHYGLRECAMMLVSMSIGSFLITWFVPESVVERLKKDLVEDILEKYCVIKLEVAGERVYQTTEHITVSNT